MCKSRIGAYAHLVIVIVAAVSLPGRVEGQSAAPAGVEVHPAGDAPADEVVILTYDVGDLILDVPDYPYPGSGNTTSLFGGSHVGGMSGTAGAGGMGGIGGMGGGMMGGGFMSVRDGGETAPGGMAAPSGPESESRSARITIEDLKRVLITVIAPDTWSENGGEEGELQHLGTSLIIRQTTAVHEQIEDLLEQLREGSGKQKTVAVDARWLLLNSDELDRLTPTSDEGGPQIDRTVLDEFTRRPTSIRGRTNCFTGQLVYLVSGTRRNVVTSFIPVVGSLERPPEGQYAVLPGGARLFEAQMTQPSRAVGYQPVIATPNLGVLLQIRPTLIPGADNAIVDLHSTLTVLGETPTEQLKSDSSPQDAMVPTVDRVAIDTQELATTLTVPLGEPVLVGGLTYIAPSAGTSRRETAAARNQPGDVGETPQLYLVLELQ